MRIDRIDLVGLRGATPAGGWATELQSADVVHTLVTVHTDAGLSGVRSVFALTRSSAARSRCSHRSSSASMHSSPSA